MKIIAFCGNSPTPEMLGVMAYYRNYRHTVVRRNPALFKAADKDPADKVLIETTDANFSAIQTAYTAGKTIGIISQVNIMNGLTTIAAIADGFTESGNTMVSAGNAVNQRIRVSGYGPAEAANNAMFLPTVVTTNKLTTTPAPPAVKAVGPPISIAKFGAVAENDIAATATGFTDVSAGFVAKGCVAGAFVELFGFTNTAINGFYYISVAAAGSITTIPAPPATEAAGQLISIQAVGTTPLGDASEVIAEP